MNDQVSQSVPSIPISYSPKDASNILDHAKLAVAKTIRGCTPRRFDYPIFESWSHIELCFASSGPVVPKLILSPDGYYCVVQLFFGSSLFLRDKMNVGAEFLGPQIGGWARLDDGPDAIAKMVEERLTAYDLADAIGTATPEQIWNNRKDTDIPEDIIDVALCGIYLHDYEEAKNMMQAAVRYAEKDGRPRYLRAGRKAELYAKKIAANPDNFRKELIQTMQTNWSHFKVVGAETPFVS